MLKSVLVNSVSRCRIGMSLLSTMALARRGGWIFSNPCSPPGGPSSSPARGVLSAIVILAGRFSPWGAAYDARCRRPRGRQGALRPPWPSFITRMNKTRVIYLNYGFDLYLHATAGAAPASDVASRHHTLEGTGSLPQPHLLKSQVDRGGAVTCGAIRRGGGHLRSIGGTAGHSERLLHSRSSALSVICCQIFDLTCC